MPDILLFGATGYTGRLTAQELHHSGASFALAGRNRKKLQELAESVGDPEVRVTDADDLSSLVAALDGCKVLVTTVGPFRRWGQTAVEAALRTGTHYIDSTGEGPFIGDLIARSEEAERAGIAMCPAMGFDEVPGDVATALAADGMEHPQIDVTYALDLRPSAGTLRSVLDLLPEPGPWIENGQQVDVLPGERERWTPFPPPLGPQSARSFPLALVRLAQLHTPCDVFRSHVAAGRLRGLAMRTTRPLIRAITSTPLRSVVNRAIGLLPEGPNHEARTSSRWSLLVEARAGSDWRNVFATGTDVYGLTAATLTTAAVSLAAGAVTPGVLSPVQAVGVEKLRRTLEERGTRIDVYAAVS